MQRLAPDAVPFVAFQLLVNLVVLFAIRNSPPTIRIRSRPEISWPSTVNSGAVRPITQVIDSSRRIRMNIASDRPSLPRPLAVCRRQLARQDRDEDDVVDAEDDLEHRQRHRGRSSLRRWSSSPVLAVTPVDGHGSASALATRAARVPAASASAPQVSGSCHISVERYSATSSAGKTRRDRRGRLAQRLGAGAAAAPRRRSGRPRA